VSNKLVDQYIQKLQTKPSFKKHKSFHWADHIELLCLANIDGEVSESDLIDRFIERERDLRQGDYDDIEYIQDFDIEELSGPTRRSEIPDHWRIDLSDWFKVLKLRQQLYGDCYPFLILDKEIKLKQQELSNIHKTYIYLLLCSNLYLFNKSAISKFTSSFEFLSLNAIKGILPSHAITDIFGTNPYNKGKYGSNLNFWGKLNLLSREIDEPISPHISKEDYTRLNRGDDGLDIVAWIPTGDNLSSKLIFLGQCACTEEWISKQSDSSHSAWSSKINFINRISNTIFIPFCYRKADGNWFKSGDIRESFLIDRKRILYFTLLSQDDVIQNLPVFKIVEEIIKTKEDVV